MAKDQMELARHHELAEFLRSRRARLLPEQVGLPNGTRRRTPSLRREEVALLAGVSPEWYTWLEQKRSIHVSGQVVENLAKALHLNADERAYLFVMALGQSGTVKTFSSPTVSPGLQQFLDQLGASPACIVDSRSTVMAWNAAWCVVYGDFAMQHPVIGELHFDFHWFQTFASSAVRLVVYTPRSKSRTAEKIERLLET